MRKDYHELRSEYIALYPDLKRIAGKLEEQLIEILESTPNIDRVICRVKGVESFMSKSDKQTKDGALKYAVPLKEIQDMIGARVVVYYKTDVQPVKDVITAYFNSVENVTIVPDDVTKFGYEGFHMICFIPNTVFSSRENPLVGDFFELQIKTLYQHAWSQSNHGLGYKPGTELSPDNQRMLAFIAAQSWGADKALAELVMTQPNDAP
jgi:putative GTP pyrophosphokinase